MHEVSGVISHLSGFNRDIVECKSFLASPRVAYSNRFNRDIVECKCHYECRHGCRGTLRFNRDIVECKYVCLIYTETSYVDLIET